MDPHSRHSQYNQRPPKSGPQAPFSRHHDHQSKMPSLDRFARNTPSADPPQKPSSITALASRPIATNSRIKQEERLRKDMYLAFVNNALQEKAMASLDHLIGKHEHYDELVDQFSLKNTLPDSPSPIPQLRQWIQALTYVVSRLDRSHATLVDAIIRMPWMTMDVSFVKSYTSFVGILVSARPEYLSVVLAKIAQGFTYQSGLQALNTSLPESSSAPLTRRTVYNRIHALLQHLLSLIPTLPSTLQPLLVRSFPHKRLPKSSQVTYIRNMLRITEYCHEIADKLLSTIIDRAIQIDVEIQVELEELEEAEAAAQPELFEIDPFDTVVGQEEDVSSDEDEDGSEAGFSDLSSDAGDDDEDEARGGSPGLDVAHITDMVGKLDAILKLIFDHFRASLGSSLDVSLAAANPSSEFSPPPDPSTPLADEPTPDERHALLCEQFQSLLYIFNRTILRTFKSRYTQFILFWFASLSPEFADTFLGELVSKALLENHQPAVTRAAAASYVASYVSRATYIDRSGARRVISFLCQFLRQQIEMYEGPNARQAAPHMVFYAVVQAVFLMFCFRWRDLLEEEAGEGDEFGGADASARKWMPELDIVQRVVTSAMNPLLVCSENVVLQFARVAQASGFIYIYPLIDANRRGTFVPSTPLSPLAATPTSSFFSFGGARAIGDLNTFFPFDPYRLPKSACYVEPVYREWATVAIDGEEDEEDEDGEEPEEQEELVGRDNAEADGLGASFSGMSISPAAVVMPTSVSMSVA
ncbi:RNA polymerase I-specific transcription initiation factor RRN3 [Vararia minispora EC-137]|uniref:RNA polymerase I-specific transcription initiation factor RRN3 n=1 Tax=Vararia minispora EC-137 TaxID=1314806 RepID=A0ACB8QGM5_9AGAM|nr:RNA polymerase I-specific transcription initiation factor RRN3 [Vararia minispora EC-137]